MFSLTLHIWFYYPLISMQRLGLPSINNSPTSKTHVLTFNSPQFPLNIHRISHISRNEIYASWQIEYLLLLFSLDPLYFLEYLLISLIIKQFVSDVDIEISEYFQLPLSYPFISFELVNFAFEAHYSSESMSSVAVETKVKLVLGEPPWNLEHKITHVLVLVGVFLRAWSRLFIATVYWKCALSLPIGANEFYIWDERVSRWNLYLILEWSGLGVELYWNTHCFRHWVSWFPRSWEEDLNSFSTFRFKVVTYSHNPVYIGRSSISGFCTPSRLSRINFHG